MIGIFLPLIALGFGTGQFAGTWAWFPFTFFLAWSATTLAFFGYWLPEQHSEVLLEEPGVIARWQNRFSWASVAWILLLHAGSDPARLLSQYLATKLPQSFPMLISWGIYTGLWGTVSGYLHQRFRHFLSGEQTSADFFRARLTLPMLFFPPMILWMLVEDLIPVNTLPAGLADLWELALAPMFFLGLYLLSPYLFNWAWSASPLESPSLGEEILNMAKVAKTPIAGIRVWNTFHEPLPNAAVAGLLEKYRFVYLTDYLMACFSPREILAVVAHELGHFRLGHVFTYLWFTIALAMTTVGVKILLFLHAPDWLSCGWMADSLVNLGFFLLAFLVIFTALARYCERQADSFAAALVGGELFASTMDRLRDYLVNPDRKIPWWCETHPDFDSRIQWARDWKGPAEGLVRRARIIRGLLLFFSLGLGLCLIQPVQDVIRFSQAAEAIKKNETHLAIPLIRMLREHRPGHSTVEELVGRLAINQGRIFPALIQAAHRTWGFQPLTDQALEIFHHPVAPEIAFYFDIMHFLLKALDLRGAHGVTLLDEPLNLLQTVFGHEGIFMDLRHDI